MYIRFVSLSQVLSADEQRQCFYACNPALNCPVTLAFEPCQSDSVRTLKVFDPNDTTLTSEARTSYATLIRSQKHAADCMEKLAEAKNMIRYSSNSTVSATRRVLSTVNRHETFSSLLCFHLDIESV